jgi:hypothetical protein
MKRAIIGLALTFGLGARAQAASPIAVDLHGGTTGGGVEIQYFASDYFAARVSGDWFDISHGFNTSDIAYSGRANWATVGVFGDVHPFKNGWLLSAGVFQGQRKASLTGAPTGDITINGTPFTPAEVGSVKGEAKLASTSPFVGLGWDSAQHAHSGVTFRALAGAAFGGPKVSLSDSGPAAGTAPVQSWLAQEQADAQSKVNVLSTYPVVQLGVGYRF